MLLVENLEEYAEYNISVRAFTKVGPGPFSPTVIARTLETSKYCDVVREILVHSYVLFTNLPRVYIAESTSQQLKLGIQ